MRIDESRHDHGVVVYLEEFGPGSDIVVVSNLNDSLLANVDRTRTNRIRQHNLSSANYQIGSTHSKIGGGGGRFEASLPWAKPNTCSYAAAIAPYEIGNTRNMPTYNNAIPTILITAVSSPSASKRQKFAMAALKLNFTASRPFRRRSTMSGKAKVNPMEMMTINTRTTTTTRLNVPNTPSKARGLGSSP